MPSLFIEEHTTFHEVKYRFIKHNLDLRTDVGLKSIHPNIFRIYLTVGSYSITNKTEKTNIAKNRANWSQIFLHNQRNRNFLTNKL